MADKPIQTQPRPMAQAPGRVDAPKIEPRPNEAETGTNSDPVMPAVDRPPPITPSVPAVNDQTAMVIVDRSAEIRDSGQFRLETAHTWPGDVFLEAGTIVGDDTEYPLYEGFIPSKQMTELVDGKEPPKPKQKGLPGQGGRSR